MRTSPAWWSVVGPRRRWEELAALLQQAQRAGAVRRDIDVRDVIALLAGASQTRRYAPDDRPLAVILDGLRVPIAR